MRSDFAQGDKRRLFGENSLRRHVYSLHSRDISTPSRVCSRGSALNMTIAGSILSTRPCQSCNRSFGSALRLCSGRQKEAVSSSRYSDQPLRGRSRKAKPAKNYLHGFVSRPLDHLSAKNNVKLVILSERERMRARVEGSMYFAQFLPVPKSLGKSEQPRTRHAASLPHAVSRL